MVVLVPCSFLIDPSLFPPKSSFVPALSSHQKVNIRIIILCVSTILISGPARPELGSHLLAARVAVSASLLHHHHQPTAQEPKFQSVSPCPPPPLSQGMCATCLLLFQFYCSEKSEGTTEKESLGTAAPLQGGRQAAPSQKRTGE